MSKVNGVDFRKYDAKQLTVDIQPPQMSSNYEWIKNTLLPVEFENEIAMGHLKMSVYFRGKNRNSIIRSASEFMMNFRKACELELSGYKGKYKGYLTANDYEKTIAKNRYILNLEFDGFFFDDEVELIFDAKTTATFFTAGTRDTPCIVEIYAKSDIDHYIITGFGDDEIVINTMKAGETAVIDGAKGIVTMENVNAFEKVDLWEFPKLFPGKTELNFSSEAARIKIWYTPMWI